ncbi:hypothetical protein DSL64_03795 [Dyadobacter luteus]|uniref:Uncharacterized protein n=1 Tax=Dyadobacter luteus TaxID=2259619 RepID=A0A3D8YGS9_9BACT|nr:hypothetical protein DSL64_03795 [Dyadobacter luteus]
MEELTFPKKAGLIECGQNYSSIGICVLLHQSMDFVTSLRYCSKILRQKPNQTEYVEDAVRAKFSSGQEGRSERN